MSRANLIKKLIFKHLRKAQGVCIKLITIHSY